MAQTCRVPWDFQELGLLCVLMRGLSVGSFLGADHEKDYARKGSLSLSPQPPVGGELRINHVLEMRPP